MIGLRSLAGFALASVASFSAACSSSSGSGATATKFACANNSSMSPMAANSACTSCVESNCNAEVTGAYGSGFASGDLSGGACGSFFTCIAPCACNDTTCSQKCESSLTSPSCSSALQTAGACIASKCTACSNSSSSGGASSGGSSSGTSSGGSSGGTSTGGACDNSASSGTCFQKGFPASQCTGTTGMPVSSCPTANLVGCCTIGTIEDCAYPPLTASDEMMACTQGGGTFSTGL